MGVDFYCCLCKSVEEEERLSLLTCIDSKEKPKVVAMELCPLCSEDLKIWINAKREAFASGAMHECLDKTKAAMGESNAEHSDNS